MSISVDVHLLSCKTASLEVEADASVELLKQHAQSALVTGRGILRNSLGEALDKANSITEMCSKTGDMLTLHVGQVQPTAAKEATLHNAFAAVLGDRSVVTWGDAGYGGDRSTVQEQLRDVQQIQASPRSFAATLGDAWGNSDRGDDSSAVQQQLKNLQQIPAFDRVLAAITGDGSVVTWGDAGYGGNSSAVQGQLRDVQQIQASPRAFAAILGDGFVAIPTMVGTGTVQQIQASHRAFLAILGVGSVVTWNNSDRGADSGVVQKQLPRDSNIP